MPNLATSAPIVSAAPSDAEWQARVELAACYRLAAHYRMTDLIYTHITARVPDEEGRFLINPYGHRWEEITASSLVKIDVEGIRAPNKTPRGRDAARARRMRGGMRTPVAGLPASSPTKQSPAPVAPSA